jgi:hypothetical protein
MEGSNKIRLALLDYLLGLTISPETSIKGFLRVGENLKKEGIIEPTV